MFEEIEPLCNSTCPLSLMYNCITTFPQKYDAYVNKTFDVHLKFN
jgi:hypothetical protein